MLSKALIISYGRERIPGLQKEMTMLTAMAVTRRIKRITQIELSRLTGIPQTTISLIENGNVIPSLSIRERLSTAVGLNASDLVRPYDEFVRSGPTA